MGEQKPFAKTPLRGNPSTEMTYPPTYLVVPHPKTPIPDCLYHLFWFYILNVSEFSCLAKSYSVSGPTPLPHIPNQLHFIQRSAHEAPEANCEARVMPVFISKSFVLSNCD